MAAKPSDNLEFSQLNAEQRRGHAMAVEERRSLFITGEAGTGKSTLVKFIIDDLSAQGLNVALTAYNGIAALNVGGTTLCKWSGFGPFDETIKYYSKRKKPPATWTDTDVLIIDEISVISAELFDKIEELARVFRKSKAPFGGMQIIAMGDFFQLPPVSPKNSTAEFCFTSRAWRAHIKHHVVLTQVIRQQNAKFVHMLREVRMGAPSAKTIRALNKRVVGAVKEIPEKHGVRPTIIYSHKQSVEAENRAELLKLSGASSFYDAKTSCTQAHDGEKELEAIIRNCQATKRIELRVGAQVMLVANVDIEEGLVNGSRGVVVKLKPERVKVQFDNGVLVYVKAHFWKKERRSGHTNTVVATIATYTQIPLMLAWAMTTHKSQGLTISCLAADTSRTFASGQTYVCLSRATTLEGLYLLAEFKRHHAKTDPAVVAFYQSIAPAPLPETLISSSDEDEDDPPLFSPHFGVTVPGCFDRHAVCTQCSFIFCAECMDNLAEYCPASHICHKCKDTHVVCAGCQQAFCPYCRENTADYCWDMELCFDCVAGAYEPKRRRLK